MSASLEFGTCTVISRSTWTRSIENDTLGGNQETKRQNCESEGQKHGA